MSEPTPMAFGTATTADALAARFPIANPRPRPPRAPRAGPMPVTLRPARPLPIKPGAPRRAR